MNEESRFSDTSVAKARWKFEQCVFSEEGYCRKIRHGIHSGTAVVAHCLPCKEWKLG